MCVVSSRCLDSLTDNLNSSKKQLTGCSAVISHSFVVDIVVVHHYKVTGSLSKENAQFI